jgi:hypothetical protein
MVAATPDRHKIRPYFVAFGVYELFNAIEATLTRRSRSVSILIGNRPMARG